MKFNEAVSKSAGFIDRQFYRQRLTSSSGIQLEKIGDKAIHLNDILIVELTLTLEDSLKRDMTIEDFYPAGFEILSTSPEWINLENAGYYQYPTDGAMVFYIRQHNAGEIKIRYPLRAITKGALRSGYSKLRLIDSELSYYDYKSRTITVN